MHTRYKARPAFEGILGYLDAQHAEQVKRGITTNASTDSDTQTAT